MSRLSCLVLMILGCVVWFEVSASAEPGGKPVNIVAFGDSLTAGYGLARQSAFPFQLQKALAARGHNIVIANAGVSGDTTAGGLARFDWAIPEGTEAVILELGANDALRGIKPSIAKANLDKILTRLKKRNIAVVLAGMNAPKNWGHAYADEFGTMYSELARKHDVLHYPFFLKGAAMNPKLSLPDGLHPNAHGVARIVKNILPMVEELVALARTKRVAVE